MTENFSVTARFTQALVDAAQRQGAVVPAGLLNAAGPSARVPMAMQGQLWTLFTQACSDPLAALRLGADLQAGHLDIVGMLLLSCETLGEGLEVLTEYAPIIGDNARFEVVNTPTYVELRYQPDYTVCVDQRVEAALACVVNLTRWMTQNQFGPREVLFMHAPRAAQDAYAAVLGCPVQFAQASNGVRMQAADLNLRLIQAGQQLHAHLRGLADEMLASLSQGSVSAQVQQLIRAHPGWGKERVADNLGMSGRHLNRKLADEAISFKGLREALLYDMAAQSLRAGQTVVAVSEKLGFSDENAFSRAFRRWSGQTPAQFARTEG